MDEENYLQEQNGISNERRSARAIKRNYAATMSEEEESMNEPTLESESRRIFVPEIDQILWRKTESHTGTLQYLVKYKDRSYFHTEWLDEMRILNEKNGKQKINRFNKVFDKRIMEEFDEVVETQYSIFLFIILLYFDPAFQEVDRVLSCTEIFPIVHPKKGSEMKGKWAESLTKVISHLLNFSRNQIHYGVYFLESKAILDFGTINNRLYLGQYKSNNDFWNELGTVFKSANQEFQENSEMRQISDTLRECAIVLYNQWYEEAKKNYEQKLSQQRYCINKNLLSFQQFFYQLRLHFTKFKYIFEIQNLQFISNILQQNQLKNQLLTLSILNCLLYISFTYLLNYLYTYFNQFSQFAFTNKSKPNSQKDINFPLKSTFILAYIK